MIRTVLGVAVLAFGATALVAQTDPIAARKALMKTNGDQNRVATEMLEGKRPFNLDEAKKVFVVFAEAGKRRPCFPTIRRLAATRRRFRRSGKTRLISTPSSPSLPASRKQPATRRRTWTPSRFKSPRCARIAADATRLTASGRPKHLTLVDDRGRPSQRRSAL